MRFLAFMLTILFLSNAASAGPLDKLTYFTEEYPPYNMTQDGDKTGISIELISAIFKAADTNKSLADVKVVPWSRGYQKTLSQPNTVVFATTRTEQRENKFKWVGPIADTSLAIIGPKDALEPDKLTDLNNYRIATIRDDVAEQLLLEGGISTDAIHSTAKIGPIIRLLEKGRVDYWAYERNVASYVLKKKNLGDQYESKHTLSRSKLYFAFNPDTDPDVIDAFETAFEKVEASGKHQEILDKYLN